MDAFPLYLYYGLFVLLSVHGLHRVLLVFRVLGGKPGRRPLGDIEKDPPWVTVQLPLYNELYVAERLIDAVAGLDWPRDRLEIQVLDDSTDETVGIVARRVASLQARGHRIRHVRRPDRQGFKAGALAFGLEGDERNPPARGEYVAVFDADFLPRPDFLKRSVAVLHADPRLAVAQGRWEHINRDHCLMTRLQAVFLDAHFAVEHEGRQLARNFLNFNGTAGVWRRSAIEEAGGWSHDTLTEDLDLSFRAQMAGLEFCYLHDLAVPSELPVEMNAFKCQQHRWAKGAIETACKLLPALLGRKDIPLRTRLEGAFHLTNNVAYLVMVCVTLLTLPIALVRGTDIDPRALAWIDLYLITLGILPVVGYLMLGQLRVGRGLGRSLCLMPMTLALGIGLSLNAARGIVAAVIGRRSGFVRTPKYSVDTVQDTWLGKRYLAAKGLWPVLEASLGAYAGVALYESLIRGNWSHAIFMLLFSSGFLYVGLASLLPSLIERLRFRYARLGSWAHELPWRSGLAAARTAKAPGRR